MTRTVVPYAAPDLSALARTLERALADHQITHGRLPGHVEMMNLLARGAGKRNLQQLQADARRGRVWRKAQRGGTIRDIGRIGERYADGGADLDRPSARGSLPAVAASQFRAIAG